MYYYSTSQTATLLILKCPAKQSPKKVPRGGQREKQSCLAFHPNAPDIPLTLYQWDALSPRMTNGAAGNTVYPIMK
ncbi:hypothetical protein CEXT_401521 [Caerostris extrusa]|uniref:Uncharacterized protein n=1 Tax=Caerostris extrusa TaxID=172846 RepID=A0AAV4NIZ3_CAEEX|nr:hypothetical protein CEXT_401521 [Caerostris extrusa]